MLCTISTSPQKCLHLDFIASLSSYAISSLSQYRFAQNLSHVSHFYLDLEATLRPALNFGVVLLTRTGTSELRGLPVP